MVLQKYIDPVYKFAEIFDSSSGFYFRSDVFGTKTDSFMRSFPALIDIGTQGHCLHGLSGKCKMHCYQKGSQINQPNMSLEAFKNIIDQCEHKVPQVALGGRGDPDQHENFKEILEFCRHKGIVPNYTTSGFNLTDNEIAITKEYVGAVAVSWYKQEYSQKAIEKFIAAGVKTNIHFVLGKSSIVEATQLLKTDSIPGLNAYIFLLFKPVCPETRDNVLTTGDPHLQEFFDIVDNRASGRKIGFDSCSIPGLLCHTKNIDPCSLDFCEAARYSCYIDSNMIMVPCSFDTEKKFGVDLRNHTIEDAWTSPTFEQFRQHYHKACPSCKDRALCMGGCPLMPEITLCNRPERS